MNAISSWLTVAGAFITASLLPAAVLLALGILVIRMLMGLVEKALGKLKLEKSFISKMKRWENSLLFWQLNFSIQERMTLWAL